MCLVKKAELKCNCSLAASQAAVLSQPRTQKICTTRQFYRCYAPEIFNENNTYEIEVIVFIIINIYNKLFFRDVKRNANLLVIIGNIEKQ